MTWYEILIERQPSKKRWIDRYYRFLKTFGKDKKTSKWDAKHHILPKGKTMFPEYSDLKSHRWNSIILTEHGHYLAHWMLSKILGGGMWVTFHNKMCRHPNGEHRTGRLYSESRKYFIEAQSQSTKDKVAVHHEIDSKSWRMVSKPEVGMFLEQGWSIGNGKKGKPKTKSMKWYRHPDTNESYRGNSPPEGFVRGRSKKGKFNGFGTINDEMDTIHNKGRIGINNGSTNKYIDRDADLPNGWEKGWIK